MRTFPRWWGSICAALGTMRPEALFGWPGTLRYQLLSDDGGIKMRGKECKRLKVAEQGFRSLVFERF